jgi:hypothetical protein
MIRFIVPLQSPAASDNWSRVSELCNITLQSITSQTNKNYEVVLICNELPVGFLTNEKVTVILTDLPVPREGGEVRMADKWKKVRIGLANFRTKPDAYYMVVDADDRVSNQLVDFIVKADYKPGWYFDRGFVYDWGFPWLYKHKRFDLICGTSSVVFCPSNLLPQGPDDPADHCYITKYGHTRIKSFFDTQPLPLKALPFYGCVYMLNTGENHTRTFYLGIKSRREQVKRLLAIRLITKKIKNQFQLWDI